MTKHHHAPTTADDYLTGFRALLGSARYLAIAGETHEAWAVLELALSITAKRRYRTVFGNNVPLEGDTLWAIERLHDKQEIDRKSRQRIRQLASVSSPTMDNVEALLAAIRDLALDDFMPRLSINGNRQQSRKVVSQ